MLKGLCVRDASLSPGGGRDACRSGEGAREVFESREAGERGDLLYWTGRSFEEPFRFGDPRLCDLLLHGRRQAFPGRALDERAREADMAEHVRCRALVLFGSGWRVVEE